MPGRVLIVDDDRVQREVLCEILQLHGHAVLFAQDGAEAERVAKADSPDIVLLDVNLRDKSGLEVCRHLKQYPATMHIPVILMSGLSDTSDRIKGLDAGAEEFLGKPYNIAELLMRVDRLLVPEKRLSSAHDAD